MARPRDARGGLSFTSAVTPLPSSCTPLPPRPCRDQWMGDTGVSEKSSGAKLTLNRS